MCRALVALGVMLAALGARQVSGQGGLDSASIALRTRLALMALDRYLETWNSRDATLWATSLHFPHVRPGVAAFAITRTPEDYAAGVNFAQTLSTGWHHSEWVSRDVLQVGVNKVHAAGSWRRYAEDGRAMTGSDITYIVTHQNGRWGVQGRFAAGATGLPDADRAKNVAAGLGAVEAFMQAWNSHDPRALAAAVHYPHVRMADDQLELWNSADDLLTGPEPGRQRTWFATRLDAAKAVQATVNGVNVAVVFSRMGRDGRVLATDEGIFLVTLRNGVWKVQARSTMGS